MPYADNTRDTWFCVLLLMHKSCQQDQHKMSQPCFCLANINTKRLVSRLLAASFYTHFYFDYVGICAFAQLINDSALFFSSFQFYLGSMKRVTVFVATLLRTHVVVLHAITNFVVSPCHGLSTLHMIKANAIRFICTLLHWDTKKQVHSNLMLSICPSSRSRHDHDTHRYFSMLYLYFGSCVEFFSPDILSILILFDTLNRYSIHSIGAFKIGETKYFVVLEQ